MKAISSKHPWKISKNFPENGNLLESFYFLIQAVLFYHRHFSE
ncbi:hypothetical protein AM1_F0073 (plasmid) [Acaryochloris marina MBIC11017]|uniref:Uncharacterized protein n=1 Tax=Acaryochloris marina (strain MBIC 11017) TaxID=329726 RepID=A8ZL43_ACAM1|nr:hypothetical protein AM1_B0145 [Acaryochloris marina MBIC11017]ABW33111.1 hypothetical protein AM1_F0073 [Acaryochloris marina MBIC11017]